MARIPFDLTVTDDFGLGRLGLGFAVGASAAVGGADGSYRAARAGGLDSFEAGATAFDRKVVFDLQPLLAKPEALQDPANPIRPGAFLALRFEAADRKPLGNGKTGQVSRSDTFTFRVVTPSELLRELLRRQNEQRMEFEKVFKKHRADAAEFRDLKPLGTAGQNLEKVRRRVRTLGRRQRHMARSVLTIARHYAQILDELGNNRLAEESKVNRLRSRIVLPLEGLGKRHMPALARTIGAYSRSGTTRLRENAEKGYDEITKLMRLVLRQMTQLETFTRILNTLREVIRYEDRAAAEARAALKREMEELFGKDKKDGGSGR